MKSSLSIVIFISISLLTLPLVAQNLESIGKEKPITVSGGVAINQIFYGTSGIQSRRDPYTFFASGNVNLSFYGWSVPLSFSYSNQNTTFQQPFNQYSLHPTYKWVTAHAGYTSMSYSPYTVNGHIFLGGAVDLAPEGNWKFSALYGRFLKAVQPDSTHEHAAVPSFKRMGYGFKASYNTGKDFIDLTLFHAKDEINSIQYVPEDEHILPQENLVVSIGAGKTIFNNFLLKAELASSALTNDTRAEISSQSNLLAKTRFLYPSRLSSSFYNAFKTSFNYQQDAYTIGIAYERIDPRYRTLGAYYFNNDLENITVNGATSILQGKVNVAVSAGSQHDNLDKSKISTMHRAVGSLNVNYTASQRLNFAASYSNFQTYTNIRSQFQRMNQVTPYDNLDTLNFTQLSQNATFSMMFMMNANEEIKQSINFNFAYQNASDKQGDVTQNSGMKFYNFNTGYALSLIPQNTSISLSFNSTINEGAMISSKTLGPVVSLTRSFFEKKFRTTLSSTYNNTYSSGRLTNTITNIRFSAILSIHKKHNLNLSAVAVNRDIKTESIGKSFTEFTGTLGYSYSFGSL
jgi:hypothetical protein